MAIKGRQLCDVTVSEIYDRDTKLWRGFLASSVEQRANARVRWRGEGSDVSAPLLLVGASINKLSHKGVIRGKCKSLLCMVYSTSPS